MTDDEERSYLTWEEVKADWDRPYTFAEKYFIMPYWRTLHWFDDAWFNIRMLWQRTFRGYSDLEVWSLDTSMAAYLLPRLRALKETTHGYPHDLTEELWDKYLAEMIWCLDRYLSEEYSDFNEEESSANQRIADKKRIQAGFQLIGLQWMNLWD